MGSDNTRTRARAKNLVFRRNFRLKIPNLYECGIFLLGATGAKNYEFWQKNKNKFFGSGPLGSSVRHQLLVTTHNTDY